jgi:beta-lactamase regulating signal transducer with metallopeptidase domain
MTALFDRLAQASLEGSLLIAGVWLVCRLAPALPASFRVVLWWLATLKLLVGLAGIDPIPLPILPPAALPPNIQSLLVADGRAKARPYQDRANPVADAIARVASGNSYAGPSFSSANPANGWRDLATRTWLIAVGALFLVALRQRQRTRRLIASARPADPRLLDVVDSLAVQVGLVGTPDTLRDDRVESPMVAGLFAPVVLLPRSRFDALPDALQRMAICHELVHLRRGDLWLGCVPALAERLFFFHPLAHVAAREYLLAREAACDAAVLRAMDATPQDYGRLLLALGVSPLRAGFAASSTSRSFSSLKRRIGMLNHTTPSARARYAGWLLAAAAAVAIVPMQVVARTAPEPTSAAKTPTPTPVEQDFSPAQQSPALQSEALQKVVQNVSALTANPVQVETRTSGNHPEFVLVLGENHTVMNGSADDRKIAKIRRAGDHALWFKYQGKEYLTTDPAVLAEAEAIYRPVSQIGEQQGEIGAKQGAVGAQQGQVGAEQGAIGAKQGAIGAKQGAIGAKQGAIGAKQSRNLSEAEQKELDAEMANLDKEMRALDERMKDLDREMERAGQPMAELDARMKELDVQMQTLDKQMDSASAKADAQMDALIERLVKSGAAQEMR